MKQEQLDAIRHSLAHLLAAAALEFDPKAQLGVGPAIDTGFYYDILFSKPLSDHDLPALEKRMKEIIKANLPFSGKDVNKEEALQEFTDQPFKQELINEFSEEGRDLSIYHTGDLFKDLCRGGHIENTSEIDPDSFELDRIAGAYWRGDQENAQLTRVYGLAFENKEQLEGYKKMREEAKLRDHRKLGKELDLFTFSETVGKGLPLWTHKGAAVRRTLERFIVDEEIKRGYLHVKTPDLASIKLYEKSGHYPYYKDSMYAPIQIDDEQFMLRPMTCPHHYELYLSRPRSYRELPMRIAELAQLYRYEQSGELSGLIRVRTFTLADAHIICKDKKQAIEEVSGALDLIEYVADKFGLVLGEHYWYRLSLGNRTDDTKYYKNDSAWEESEDALRTLLQSRTEHFVEAEDEAAFYGPKIDIQMKNVSGKEDTAFTVQYDFCMPDRFDLTYVAEDGSPQRPLVVHRSSIGAIERIMGFLIEHYAGAFPLWLAPVQVAILPINEEVSEYAKQQFEKLRDSGIRAELYGENETLGKKIRRAKLEKVPYFLVIGKKEVEDGVVMVESRDDGKVGALSS